MSSPFGTLHAIVNPHSGRGLIGRAWPDIERVLRMRGLELRVAFTERHGHAAEIARDALESGARFVVAVGGDGTVNEVVNGMMGPEKPLNPDAVLGVVAAGTGCDFAKTFGLPQNPIEAAAHLDGERLFGRIDVARISCVDSRGESVARWWVNVGEAGLGAAVVARAARLPRWLGGTVYRLAALWEIVGMRPVTARIEMHGRKARGSRVDAPLSPIVHEGLLDLLVVANCQFYGGGMRVAPRAIPEDGMLDVLATHLGRREAAALMKKMFEAKHVPHPKVAEYLASRVRVTTDRPILVEVDGEVVGTTPAQFDLVPGALPLKV